MKKTVTNNDILNDQINKSNELVDFQKKYVPSADEQIEINDLIGDMDIFNIKSVLANDKSNYKPIELLDGNNSLISARNAVIKDTNQLILDFPNANIVKVDDDKFIMFRDMVEDTIKNIDEEACKIMIENIKETRKHEEKLKHKQDRMSYFTIKFTEYDRTFIVFEYMPLPPSQMLDLKIPLPKFRFITLGTETTERPDIDDTLVDTYVAKFYYEFEKLHTIDEAKIDCNITGAIVEEKNGE